MAPGESTADAVKLEPWRRKYRHEPRPRGDLEGPHADHGHKIELAQQRGDARVGRAAFDQRVPQKVRPGLRREVAVIGRERDRLLPRYGEEGWHEGIAECRGEHRQMH